MTQKHSGRMRRLVAAGLLPERAGQPVKAWAHISLADLLLLDAGSALQEQWTAQVRARWAARRAFASETGANGGAWLDGDAAGAIACDAAMAPIVTGDVNVDALRGPGPAVRRARPAPPGGDGAARTPRRPGPRSSRPSSARPSTFCPAPAGSRRSCAAGSSARGWAGRACRWTSGTPRPIPPGIRNAVILRDRTASGPAAATSPPRVRSAPHPAQGRRRPDQHQGLRAAVHLPPPDRDPPAGLDPGPEPRRHHDRVARRGTAGPGSGHRLCRPWRPARPAPARPAPRTPGSGPRG